MMRLLFLCLLLLLPAAAAVSEDNEGSGDDDQDDEDFDKITGTHLGPAYNSPADKTTGVDETSNEITLIVIIVAVSAVTLSIAVIVAVILVRRHMNTRQQGIYSVPTEQGQKGTV